MEKLNLKFLQSLATQYPSVAKACTEIINLQAILNLPKETEHFVSDVHGEYEQFLHILKTGSGAIRNKIEDVLVIHSAPEIKESGSSDLLSRAESRADAVRVI